MKVKSKKSKSSKADAESKVNIKKAKKKGAEKSGGKDADDLARMKAKFKKQKDKEEGKSGGGNDALDKLEEGKNNRRILPREGTREFYLQVAMHFGVGPDGKAVRCIGKLSEDGWPLPGTKCPLCKMFLKERARINEKYGKGSEEGKTQYLAAKDKYAPKPRYYMNVLRPDGEVKVLTAGEMILSQLLEMWLEDDSTVGDFTDPENGRWLNIKKIKTGKRDRDVKYKVIAADEAEEIDMDDLSEKLHDLDAVAGAVLSPEDIQAIMTGGADDDDDEDEDEDEDDASADDESGDDDDEEEDGIDDDDDEEEDDDDEDEDEDDEEEEEEEKPAKKKKSKK